ncbi:alpha/beta hydrolase (plasmid) [Pseudoalteromonas xiamenensis]|uniref:alpha/beta fold hydrolase n=1 Tax=Pseudoalteromonas xiamenensis TaxID=882626 RepID=UPI0027E5689A|nr:alpha/beta fold hydrolase [Pseudoalteromonas xiamenensis]WMN62243.1 alpha/beta hydrolase [Pseudoalteromonas xiamenensis]
MIKQESILLPFGGAKLHLRRIYDDENTGEPVFFMHGAVENGKIFYTESNKGLAPFLAEHGYDCYVADLRGRGKSIPNIGPGHSYGQTEAILEDIPTMLEGIKGLRGKYPRFWVAHSWGGVLMNSYFARFPEMISHVDACVYFGSKRSLYNRHPQKFIQGNLIWYGLAPILAKKHGYLPARKLKWGSDEETVKSHRQSMEWAKIKPWVDSDDNFDYAKTLSKMALPPILHIAGVKDKALAQPIDIKKFMEESGLGTQEIRIFGKRFGHKCNYDHINMLTHPNARLDQFQDALFWFQSHLKNRSL